MEEIKVNPATSNKNVVKPLSDSSVAPSFQLNAKIVGIFVGIIVLGIGSGYAVYAKQTAGTVRLAGKDVEVVKTPTEEGVKDASTFKDTTMGQIKANDGKLTQEGSHILLRGDVSQNVYLTSSVIDLSKYEGKKVQVWGETFQGQKAGWLMDVGRIKVL